MLRETWQGLVVKVNHAAYRATLSHKHINCSCLVLAVCECVWVCLVCVCVTELPTCKKTLGVRFCRVCVTRRNRESWMHI